jgi:predicted nucleotidyltransferase component of viral defense system
MSGSSGLAQSVQTRLVQHAKGVNMDPNLVMTRFAMERFLYRLSHSPEADRFVLKGALLLLVWLGETIRPTRDADLLGFGDLADDALAGTFRDTCGIPVEPDGMTYLRESVEVASIRREDPYGGKRVVLQSRLGSARIKVQVDVGIGDAVIPPPEWVDYPSLLGFPAPHLRAYAPETAIAEKVHAMVTLGSKNSRMRDFFDVHALSERTTLDGRRLSAAVRSTFERRRTPIPTEVPIALTPAFADLAEKRAQWRGFLRRNALAAAPELSEIIAALAGFLTPVLEAGARGSELAADWVPGGPWKAA